MRERSNTHASDEEATVPLAKPSAETELETDDPERERRLHELFRIGQMRRDASYRSRGLFDLR